MVSFSTVSGGGVSVLTGGNFWEGATTAFYVSLLNHSAHKITEAFDNKETTSKNPFYDIDDRPYKYNGKTYENKGELYGANLIDQVAEQFGIKDIVSLAAAIDDQGLLSKPFQAKGASKGTSLASKYGSELIPWQMPKRLPTHMRDGVWRYTKVFGRFLGRMAGPIGWGILAYDVGITLYNTQTIYNSIVNEK